MADERNMDSKFRDSHITGKHSSFEDGAMKANTLMSPRRTAVSKAMQRTRVSVGSVTTAAAKCVRSDRDHYRIIVSYRDNFDLSYRLSIGNSIWHIVTAL